MKTLLNRVADRLLGSVAPRVEAAAACSFYACGARKSGPKAVTCGFVRGPPGRRQR